MAANPRSGETDDLVAEFVRILEHKRVAESG